MSRTFLKIDHTGSNVEYELEKDKIKDRKVDLETVAILHLRMEEA